MKSNHRAIINIKTIGKSFSKINYSRRMYAIIRRYTPEVAEGEYSECFAELTGLRTFFKMSYKELTEKIIAELTEEIGIKFTVKASSPEFFEKAKAKSKRTDIISTYKELNNSLSIKSYKEIKSAKFYTAKNKRLPLPFLGKVV